MNVWTVRTKSKLAEGAVTDERRVYLYKFNQSMRRERDARQLIASQSAKHY